MSTIADTQLRQLSTANKVHESAIQISGAAAAGAKMESNDIILGNDNGVGNRSFTGTNMVDMVKADLSALLAATLTAGAGDADFRIKTSGNYDLVLKPNDDGSLITIPDDANGNILINPGTGNLVVGGGADAGTIQSSGDNDLDLRTGNSTTGSILIVDGAAGDISLRPNGAGKAILLTATSEIGSSGGNATLQSSGNHNLIMKTGNATTGSITIVNGTNGAINIAPNGSGNVDIGSNLPSANSHAANKLYVDNVSQGIRWNKPVRAATAAPLPDSPTENSGVLTAGANGSIVVDGINLSGDDRVLVKDQGASVKGKLIFTCSDVPSVGETYLIEFNDLYYQVDFSGDADSTVWAGGNGANSGVRKTFNVKRDDVGENVTTIATSVVDAFRREANTNAQNTAGVVTLEQFNPTKQAVANNIAGTAANSEDTVVAGTNTFNGLYKVTTQGDGGNPYVLTRVTEPNDLNSLLSAAVFVMEGTTNRDSGFVQQEDFIVNYQLTSQTWLQFTGLGSVTAGDAIIKDGNILAVGGINTLADPAGDGLAHGDLMIVADVSAANVTKKASVHQLAGVLSGAAEFANPSNGQLALAGNGVALSKLARSATAGHFLVGKAGGADSEYEVPKELSTTTNGGIKMGGNYNPTTAARADLALDYVMAHVKLDPSGNNIAADGTGTNQANTLKFNNVVASNKAALAAAHPMAKNVMFFRNGVLAEDLMALTNMYGAQIDGDNKFTFFNDGSSLDLYIKSGGDKSANGDWGLDDITVIFGHQA